MPEEALIFRGNDTVNLTQTPPSVMVTLWTDTKQERELTTLAAVNDLAPWVLEKLTLRAQILAGFAAKHAEEDARQAALPLPDLDEDPLREAITRQPTSFREWLAACKTR